jgi:hypothetical protein
MAISRYASFAKHFLGGFVVAGLAGGALVNVLSAPAEAVPPAEGRACLIRDWGVWIQRPADFTPLGSRADVYVYPTAQYCQRISSVYSASSAGGFYEFGWIKGYSRCPGYTNWYDNATTFVWARDADGYTQCAVFNGQHPSMGSFHNFRVSDSDQNLVWKSILDGVEQTNAARITDFYNGQVIVGAERAKIDDVMLAHFTDIRNLKAGNWTLTTTLSGYDDSDPNYHQCIDSGSQARVTTALC